MIFCRYGCGKMHHPTERCPKLGPFSVRDTWSPVMKQKENSNDPVNSPSHYTASNIQPIDAIEAWELGFNLGQVIKYTARAGRKDPSKLIEDLQKAEFYLKREIANLQKKRAD